MLLHRTMVPRDGVRRTLRHPLESQWIAGLALSTPLVAAALTVSRLVAGLSGPVQALIALVGAPLSLLFLWILWDAARGSRRSSNWHVAFTDTGFFLNLRSWRNAHLEPADTLVEIDFEELRWVGRVFERITAVAGRAGSPLRAAFVELALGVDTAPIRAALAAERALAGDGGGRFARARTRHPHEPVQATGQRTLRVELVPGLLEAFGEHARLLPDGNRTSTWSSLAGRPRSARGSCSGTDMPWRPTASAASSSGSPKSRRRPGCGPSASGRPSAPGSPSAPSRTEGPARPSGPGTGPRSPSSPHPPRVDAAKPSPPPRYPERR